MSILPRRQRSHRSLGWVVAVAFAVILAEAAWSATPARAGLILEVPTFTAAPGTSGSFDVIVRDTDSIGSAPYNVANADLDLSLSGTGVSFTNVTIGTTTPYIFVTPGSAAGLLYTTLTATNFHTTDNEFAGSGFRAIGPGNSFGLAHVSYAVAPGAALGSRTLSINGTTELSDLGGNSFPLTFSNGSITVQVASVPEPSSLVLTLTGALVLCLARSRYRRNPVTSLPSLS